MYKLLINVYLRIIYVHNINIKNVLVITKVLVVIHKNLTHNALTIINFFANLVYSPINLFKKIYCIYVFKCMKNILQIFIKQINETLIQFNGLHVFRLYLNLFYVHLTFDHLFSNHITDMHTPKICNTLYLVAIIVNNNCSSDFCNKLILTIFFYQHTKWF